jgi:hypothetical protein
VAAKGVRQPVPGFLGTAVGHIHEAATIAFWKETFEDDVYVENILKDGFQIPVKMSPEEASTVYRERNNKSARDEMAFVRTEVKGLVASGQVIQVDSAPLCTNPLSVALKINSNGSIKKRLVINLSRWVNNFVIPDKFKMAKFQDALLLLHQGTINWFTTFQRHTIIFGSIHRHTSSSVSSWRTRTGRRSSTTM